MELVDGKIPAKTVCPYRKECYTAQTDRCFHRGFYHEEPFSCGFARGFDLLYSYKKLIPEY